MLCGPQPSMCAYYFSTFGDNAQRFGSLLLETATTDFTIMSFVCFIRTAKYGAADVFLPARLRALASNGRLWATEGVLVRLPRKMRANVLKRGTLRIIGNCAVDVVAAILDFARSLPRLIRQCSIAWVGFRTTSQTRQSF